ncbi:DNA translocase FtsK [Ralstonia pseudosolanacearum]|uniref:DNA translocase FtsK n=1 Tax=Ralstonia pseudosolanacearum TaxID=1310165 RepID=UPI003EE3F6D9
MSMTTDTLGKDLLSALVLELKMMPGTWVKLSQKKQDDIIDRLRSRVDGAVKMAVHLIAANGRTVVQGDLDQITIKDGAKAVVKIGKSATALHDLAEAQGKAVLLVLGGNGEEHTAGMDEVKGESDQRAFDLGKEYTDEDGDGMPEDGAQTDDDVVDVEFSEEPIGIEHQPLQAELDTAYADGQKAASEGKLESDCPKIAGPLCIQWVKGLKAWHDEHPEEDPLYSQAEALVVAQQRVSISMVQRHLKIGYTRASRLIEMLETKGVVSTPDNNGQREVLKTPEDQTE